MSGVATAVVGGSLVGGYLSSQAQSEAADTAAQAQIEAAKLGIGEQQRQFDITQKLLAPYIQGGTGALGAQQALLGLSGADAQQQAIAALQASPEFQALTTQGENALLQNAAATGGLRGGNVQAALAQFRPQVLSQLINQQYSRLGGLSSLGQASAAGQAALGQQTGASIADLLGQQGAAQAGSALAQGQAQAQMYGNISSAPMEYALGKKLGLF